ncbi:hypothetical protein [Ilumatobacter sp.]|uniref:hypothetical protein n=1 Tax=Ilumatobacter sp. TaxID=1967498 RepID=UPI003B52922E
MSDDSPTSDGATTPDASDPAGDPVELVSAYVDDEATTDERALVETDPDALVDVAQLRSVRAVLAASVEPASLSEREGHLAAALDVWERTSDRERSGEATPAAGVDAAAAAAVSTPASGTGRGRRPRRSLPQWVLGAAAALLVVGGAGAVLVGLQSGGTDDSAESTSDAASADTEAVDALESQVAAELQGENTNDEVDPDADLSARAEVGVADSEEETTDAMAEAADAGGDDASAPEPAAGDGSDAAASSEISSDAPTGATTPPPAEVGLVELADVDDLADFADLARRALDAVSGAPAAPPPDSCASRLGIDRIVDAARYQGIEVIVGLELGPDRAVAFTDPACEVVARTPLPDGP